MKIVIMLIWGLISTNGLAQGPEESFKKANNLYNEGAYQDAIELYESILESDQHSAELYFNLANAYYKTNQVAPSIYFYEKALLLDPDDKDIKNNLVFAQNMTIDAIEAVPDVGLSKVAKSSITNLSFDTWAILAVTFMIIFVAFFLFYYFSLQTGKKRLYFLTSFISLFLCLISLTFAFQTYEWKMDENPAIVFAEESEVRTDPNLRSEAAFKLHEGTKVEVIEEFEEQWFKIRIADGKSGWIPSEDVRLLNIF